MSELVTAIITYKYAFAALGILLVGEPVLVPALYLATIGVMDIVALMFIAVLATLLADMIWYFIGMHITRERLLKLPWVRRQRNYVEQFSSFFESNSFRILFVSRFIYGVRIVTQLLCGMHHLSFRKYFAVNAASVLVWMALLVALVVAVDASVTAVQNTAAGLKLAFAVVVALVVAIHLLARRLFGKAMSAPKKRAKKRTS